MKKSTVAVLVFLASSAAAFEAPVHEAITRSALRGSPLVGGEPLAAPGRGAVDTFRRWFYAQAVSLPDATLRGRFLARYPDVRAFDAVAFRELLGLSTAPFRRVQGIDFLKVPTEVTALGVVAAASSAPDIDVRHRDRLVYDGAPKALEASNGVVIPYDPAETNLGPSAGAASDAVAYTTLADDVTADESALSTDPSRFAMAHRFEAPVMGLASEFAARETDLARIAAAWPNPANRYLALVHAGAAIHYLEKASSPLWSVQFGSAAALDRARGQHRWRAFLTAGGTLGPLRTEWAIAEGFQRNARRFVDRRTAERLTAVGALVPDARVATESAPIAAGSAHAARSLVRYTAGRAATEAAATFGHIEAVTCGRMRVDGFVFHDPRADTSERSDSVVCDEAELPALDAATDASVARALSVVRAYADAQAPVLATPGSVADSVENLVRGGLDRMDEASLRRQAFVDGGAPGELIVRPMWAVFDGLLVFVLVAGCLLWIRRSSTLSAQWQPEQSPDGADAQR